MQRKAVKCYVSIPEIRQHLSHRCHTRGKGPHQEKQRGNVERKITFKFSFFFFPFLCSCYLKWPLPLAVKISGISVTCINRLHCTRVSAWGLIMTRAQAVCHSTQMVQKAHLRKSNSADLDPRRGPILLLLKASKSLQRANRAHPFSSSASSPLCA